MPTTTPTTPTAPTGRRTRRPVRSGVALLAGLLLLSACLTADQQSALDLLNKDRAANRAPALGTQADAQAKAQAWAEKMARDGRISHSRLAEGIKVKWCSLGENVGSAGTVAAVEAAFMRSSSHKPNIISKTWNGVGVGVAKSGGKVYVVQFFIKTC